VGIVGTQVNASRNEDPFLVLIPVSVAVSTCLDACRNAYLRKTRLSGGDEWHRVMPGAGYKVSEIAVQSILTFNFLPLGSIFFLLSSSPRIISFASGKHGQLHNLGGRVLSFHRDIPLRLRGCDFDVEQEDRNWRESVVDCISPHQLEHPLVSFKYLSPLFV